MPDSVDRILASFAADPVDAGSPAAARARGDRLRRRGSGASVAGVVLAVALVVGGVTAYAEHDDSRPGPAVGPQTTPATSGTTGGSTESAAPDPATQFWLPDPPTSEHVGQGDVPDLPLAEGIPDWSGDGGHLRTSPSLPGVDRTLICGRSLIDQDLPATGRLVAAGSGPEVGEVHQVVAYADAGAALAQMAYVRALVGGCPRVEADPAALGWIAMLFVPTPADTGYDSYTFGQYLEGALGVATFQVTRIGRAVLIVEVSGETSSADLRPQAEVLTTKTRSLAPSLCVFTAAGCGAVR